MSTITKIPVSATKEDAELEQAVHIIAALTGDEIQRVHEHLYQLSAKLEALLDSYTPDAAQATKYELFEVGMASWSINGRLTKLLGATYHIKDSRIRVHTTEEK